jgi:hypothetical protein
VIRPAGNPFKSRAGRPLLIGVLAVVAIAVVLPYTPARSQLGFMPLPLSLLGATAVGSRRPSGGASGQVLVLSTTCAA